MSISENDKKYVWHPFTQMKTAPTPIPIVKGKGTLLIDENELFVTYLMTFDDVMPKSQVGIKIIDTNNNYFESFLPFTLEVLPNDTIVITEPAEEPAEESPSLESELVEITLVTNSNSYENGDKVIITGQIQNYDLNSMMGQDILYDVISPENIVEYFGSNVLCDIQIVHLKLFFVLLLLRRFFEIIPKIYLCIIF